MLMPITDGLQKIYSTSSKWETYIAEMLLLNVQSEREREGGDLDVRRPFTLYK